MTPGSLISRVVALSVVAVALAAIVFGIVIPVQGQYEEANRTLARSQQALQRYRMEIEGLKSLEERKAALEKAGFAGNALLTGTSEALAAAKVQQAVTSAIERHKGTLETLRIAPAEEVNGLTKIAVDVRSKLTTPTLQRVLHALETASPYLFVDALSVARNRRSGQETTADEALGVRLRIYGFWDAKAALEQIP